MKKNRIIISLQVLILIISMYSRTIFAADTDTINTVSTAPKFEISKVVDNGYDYDKLVFVIMGDGYTADELTKFKNDATNLINGMLNQDPYKKFKNDINVYLINVISNVSGASDDPSKVKDTYFGSSFNIGNIQRLLAPTKYDNVYECLNNSKINYDQGIIIVNSDTYGGSGGALAVTSTNPLSIEIIMHELGHSLGGLGDEYNIGENLMHEAPNVTQESDPNLIKWSSFIGKDGIGIFPLEGTTDWFIPYPSCKMRALGQPYCAVCEDVLEKKIIEETNKGPEDATFVPDKTIETNKEVSVTINYPAYVVDKEYSIDGGITWIDYTSPVTFTDNGIIEAKGQDAKGKWSNVSSFEVKSFDKTAPVVWGVVSGIIYNSDKCITFDEGEAKLNGKSIYNFYYVTKDGDYTLIVTDVAGNSTIITFKLDKTFPLIEAKQANGLKIKSGGSYKTTSITVKITEKNMKEKIVTLNGKMIKYPDSGKFTAKGAYSIKVTDKARNTSNFKFTIK